MPQPHHTRRYAIYYAPAEHEPLWSLGNTWLGRDPEANTSVHQPSLAAIAADTFKTLTRSPRRYGLHATLKAPFSLAQDMTEDDLFLAVNAWSQQQSSFALPSLTLTTLGHFLALVPSVASPALSCLAAQCVRSFDIFRAPLSPEDIARRTPERLTDQERHYLNTWGYPYVFDAYRFHITLSDSIDNAEDRANLRQAAARWFAPIFAQPLTISGVCIFIQPTKASEFVLMQRFNFTS